MQIKVLLTPSISKEKGVCNQASTQTCQVAQVNLITAHRKVPISIGIIEDILGDIEVIDWNKHKLQRAHLKDLDFPEYLCNKKVVGMIGADLAYLTEALEPVIRLDELAPVAKLCELGMVAFGNIFPVVIKEADLLPKWGHLGSTSVILEVIKFNFMKQMNTDEDIIDVGVTLDSFEQ